MRLAVLVSTVGLATLAAAAAQAAPPAEVRASIATQGDIWVGQRVTLVVELLAPGTFASAPAFDLPRIPGVILMPPQGSPVLGTESKDDVSYTTQRHELAVYSQRPGNVSIPPFVVRFESSRAFGQPTVNQRVTTPPVEFTCKLPPGAEGLSLVITTSDLTVKEQWQPEIPSAPVKPGTAFTRTIIVEATDVPSMVLPAFPHPTPSGVGVYFKPAVTEDKAERGVLRGRRVDTTTYVCEKPGAYTLPALALAWWDPTAQELKRLELPARALDVVAPPLPATVDASSSPKNAGWRWGVWLLAALAVLSAMAWVLTPRLRHWWKRRRAARAKSEAALFAAFEQACRHGDAAQTWQALELWIDRFFASEAAPTVQSLVEPSSNPRLATVVAGLEAALFSRNPTTARWSSHDLLVAVRAARQQLLQHSATRKSAHLALPPLNPVE